MENVATNVMTNIQNFNVVASELQKKLKVNSETRDKIYGASVVNSNPVVDAGVSSAVNAAMPDLATANQGAAPTVEPVVTPVAAPVAAPVVEPITAPVEEKKEEVSEVSVAPISMNPIPNVDAPTSQGESNDLPQTQIKAEAPVETNEVMAEDNGIYRIVGLDEILGAVKVLSSGFNNIKITGEMNANIRAKAAPVQVESPKKEVVDLASDIEQTINEANVQIDESKPLLVDTEEKKSSISDEMRRKLAALSEGANKVAESIQEKEENLAKERASEEEMLAAQQSRDQAESDLSDKLDQKKIKEEDLREQQEQSKQLTYVVEDMTARLKEVDKQNKAIANQAALHTQENKQATQKLNDEAEVFGQQIVKTDSEIRDLSDQIDVVASANEEIDKMIKETSNIVDIDALMAQNADFASA